MVAIFIKETNDTEEYKSARQVFWKLNYQTNRYVYIFKIKAGLIAVFLNN